MRPVDVGVLAFALALSSVEARADELSNDELATRLRDRDEDERADAADEVFDRGSPPPLIGPLIAAAKTEHDHDVLAAMLRALGESGAVEALGLLQLHAQSPARDLRGPARKALKRWLEVNRVLGEDDDLPEPPHAFYGPPPQFPADRPAGRSVYAVPGGPSEAPYYDPPPLDGVPPGFHFEEKPRMKLVIAGSALFGALHLAMVIGGSIGANDDPKLAWAFLPVAGPWIIANDLFNTDSDFAGLAFLGGILLIVEGAGQLAGLAMLTGGLAATESVLTPNVTVGADGAQLHWKF